MRYPVVLTSALLLAHVGCAGGMGGIGSPEKEAKAGSGNPFKDVRFFVNPEYAASGEATAAKHPDEARAITEAINEATQWVKQNPGQAAKIMVDKQYILGTVPLNTELLKSYDWDPSLAMAKEALSTSAKEFKAAGILGPDADIQNYVSRSFVNLPGLATE